jgi:linoleoyl-CoA desaturase
LSYRHSPRSEAKPASPPHLSDDALAAIARELDGLRRRVRADLGEGDAAYIRRVIAIQRRLELGGRGLLMFARATPALVGGTVLLTFAKVLENMEIGHNVMHGQWDWMRDPHIQSATWEWDASSTADSWKYSHNYQHHTFTNIVGKDRDLGYSAMRVDPAQRWHPVHLLQPLYGVLIAATFEWGIAIYDMELDAVRRGSKPWPAAKAELLAFARKARRQVVKDYVAFPLLARRGARRALAATVAANLARNVWVHTIVFMGHIPEGAETFPEERLADESRGGWYVRQLLGSSNLEGRPLFHRLSGHLSYQIEHHLFPDLPSNRYPEISVHVRELCERYGLPYNSGRLGRQYRSVARKILRLSLPGGSGPPHAADRRVHVGVVA